MERELLVALLDAGAGSQCGITRDGRAEDMCLLAWQYRRRVFSGRELHHQTHCLSPIRQLWQVKVVIALQRSRGGSINSERQAAAGKFWG